jgi:hypothetical protein
MEYSIWTSPSSTGSGSQQPSKVYFGGFIAEEVDGVEDTTMADTPVQYIFLNMSLRYATFIDEVFSGKSKVSGLGLPCSSAGLSGFPNYWTLDYRNFAVYTTSCHFFFFLMTAHSRQNKQEDMCLLECYAMYTGI